MNHTNIKERILICDAIYDILNAYPSWLSLSDDTKNTIVRRLEKGCFEVTINEAKALGIERNFSNTEFTERYSNVCYKLMANIGSLLERILNGPIKLYDIPHLDSYAMNPVATQKERDDLEIRLRQKVARKVSKMYKCRKCGCNETIPLEYQGRAGDEACSFSIKCVNCEFVWRM